MASIETIENIIVWQNAMAVCDKIYDITDTADFSKDFALKDQIRRSAISIPSNIAEGFERESNRQFLYFLLVAKGSAGELRTQLLIAKNRNYLSHKEYETLYSSTIDLSKQLGRFITYLRSVIKKAVLQKQISTSIMPGKS